MSTAGLDHPGATIRTLTRLAELQACVALQDDVWGPGFGEAVPVSLLKAATYLDGILIGAFDVDDSLIGFVFGLTGRHDGRTVHWSHLLGVHPHVRNHGLGRALKECQRAELARQGISEMLWTFDPLIAKNAHLNLNVLGARVVRFTPDMYGRTISVLHHGLPTDRLVVSSGTDPLPQVLAIPAYQDDVAPVLTAEPRNGDPLFDENQPLSRRLRLEIPLDFAGLARQSPARAAAWHSATREHFLTARRLGYDVLRLHRDSDSQRAFYVLSLA